MYPESFVESVSAQSKAMIRNAVLIVLLSLAVSISLAVWVNNTLGLTLLVFGLCAFVAYWGVRGSQVWAYHRFALDMAQGHRREIEAEVVRISEEPVYKDNKLYYYEIETMQGDVERMLLWDANFPLPDIRPGQRVTFRVIEKYIWDIAG